MKKNMLSFLAILLTSSLLNATESYLLEPEVAVKMINRKNIQFLSIGKEKNIIVGSQRVDIDALFDVDVLGNMKCEPFVICPRKLKKYLEKRGITSDQELILYDSQYGINSATLYAVLKAIGHQHVKVLNGGYKSIQKLDPNQETYDKYLKEKKLIFSQDNNDSFKKQLMNKVESLNDKLSVLKPLLLIQKVHTGRILDLNKTYNLDRSKFNFDSLVDRDLLKKAVNRVREEGSESNTSILDACSMIDIVGNRYGSYVSDVYSIDWKELVNTKKKSLNSKELLKKMFIKKGLSKEKDIYVYCMEGSQKAFFMALALDESGYEKVKVFSGDWSVWRRE